MGFFGSPSRMPLTHLTKLERPYALDAFIRRSSLGWMAVAPRLNIPASRYVSKTSVSLGASGAISALAGFDMLALPTRWVKIPG